MEEESVNQCVNNYIKQYHIHNKHIIHNHNLNQLNNMRHQIKLERIKRQIPLQISFIPADMGNVVDGEDIAI